jgi:transcriptional regulator with XRE-family HTH domain
LRIEEACAQVLRRLREARGLSQHELAYEAGINRNNTSLYETAVRLPSLPTLFALARALGVKPEKLIEEIAALEPEI